MITLAGRVLEVTDGTRSLDGRPRVTIRVNGADRFARDLQIENHAGFEAGDNLEITITRAQDHPHLVSANETARELTAKQNG